MSQEIFNDELDLNVLCHGIDHFSDDLPTETAENLLTRLKAIQQGDPDATRDLVTQFQENQDLDRIYTRSLRDLRRNYSTRERAKSLTMAREYPSEYDFSYLGDLIAKIGDLLTNRKTLEIDALETEILQALDKYRLSIEYLAHTIGQPLPITQKIVQSLWKKGYIDYLQSPTLYILFPGLRSTRYRHSPVNPNAFLTLTRRGYFHLYPVFSRSRIEATT
jgi:hypothetical protein